MKKIFALLIAAVLVVTALCTCVTVSAETVNVALGKSYTKSQLFQQGESVDEEGNKKWGWLDSAPVSYPDEGDKTLTDGKLAADDSTYSGEEWMGFHSGCPDYATNGYSYFTVDLGESYDLSKLVVHVGTSKLTGGIGVPATVEFLVSEDGTTFTSVGSVVPADDPDHSVLAVEQNCNAAGRYVQVRMTAANWMFVCEFEAFADPSSAGSPAGSEDTTTEDEPTSTPDETTPAESTPDETTPAESTPAESTPAESTPAESTPAASAPAESTPAASSEAGGVQTGDVQLVLFVLLGLAAVAGVCFAVRKRA